MVDFGGGYDDDFEVVDLCAVWECVDECCVGVGDVGVVGEVVCDGDGDCCVGGGSVFGYVLELGGVCEVFGVCDYVIVEVGCFGGFRKGKGC